MTQSASPREPQPAGDAPDEPEQERRRRPRARLRDLFEAQAVLPGGLTLTGIGSLGAAVVVLFLVGAAVVWFIGREPQAQVPSLVGVSRAQAEARLREAHLSLRAIHGELSPEPAGTVLRTDPVAGTELDREAGVSLVLAVAGSAAPPPTAPPQPPAGSSGGAHGGTGTVIITVPEPRPGSVDRPGPGNEPSPAGAGTGRRTDPPAGPTGAAAPLVMLGAGRVDPDPAYDSCDTGYRFDVSQQVSLTRAGQVTYRWLRSDDASGPVYHLDFAEPGTRTASTWWQRTAAAGETIDGWQQIEILTPVPQRGQRIPISHRCPESPG